MAIVGKREGFWGIKLYYMTVVERRLYSVYGFCSGGGGAGENKTIYISH